MMQGLCQVTKTNSFVTFAAAQGILYRGFLLSMLSIIAFLTTSCCASTDSEGGKFDLVPFLQKLPRVAPFIASKFDDEFCQEKFHEFKRDTDTATSQADLQLPTKTMLKMTVCRIPETCVLRFATAFKRMLNQGGLVEKVSREYFEGKKGVDITKMDVILTEGIQSFCEWKRPSQRAEL